jgi:hypothetical protein
VAVVEHHDGPALDNGLYQRLYSLQQLEEEGEAKTGRGTERKNATGRLDDGRRVGE